MSKRGFSLIELIVVIGIVAILSSLLFPALMASRSRAYGAVCTSNLRQLGMAMQLYQSDFGAYPLPTSDTFNSYIGGAHLACPAVSGGFNFSVYEGMTWFEESAGSSSSAGSYHAQLGECFQKRGVDFPLIADVNHMPKVWHDDKEIDGVALAFRVSGAVQRIPGQRVVQIDQAIDGLSSGVSLPCSQEAQLGNL